MSKSVWHKRLLIAGALILGVSIAVMVSAWPSWMETLDPEKNHLLKLDGGDNESVNLSKESSYLLFRLESGVHNCTVIEDATGTEVTIGSPSWIQSDREGVDGEWYYAVGTFIPDESGQHDIQNNAASGDVLWVIDEMDLANNSDSSYITGGCLGIILGGCLLPIAFGLWMSGKKNAQNAGIVMQHRVPTTDEIWRSVHGGEVLDLTVQQHPPEDDAVPAPFADRPDRVGELTKVVDEIETVDEAVPQSNENNGETTEGNWKSWDEG